MTTLTSGSEQSTGGEAAADQVKAGASADASAGSTQQGEAAKAGDSGEAAKPAAGVPETYEDFKAPEGKQFPEGFADQVKGYAKDLGLNQEQAQKLAERELARTEEAQSAQVATLEKMHADWAEQVKLDKEFGGEKLEENLAIVNTAINAFASPALVELLDSSKLRSHPEVIRAFLKIGKQISADTFVGGENRTDKNPLSDLYPSMNK